MGFSLPSLSSIGQSIGNVVQQAAEKVADAVTQQKPSEPAAPAGPQAPVDSFEASEPSKGPSLCGGNSTEGEQCLPEWGKNGGGGGGGLGVNPSRGSN